MTAQIATANGAAPPVPAVPRTLARDLRRAERGRRLGAWLLLAPLLAFLTVSFLLPLTLIVMRSVQDHELSSAMPRSAAALRAWDGAFLPDADTAAVVVEELRSLRRTPALSQVANRLNFDLNGARSLILATVRKAPADAGPDPLHTLREIDPIWGEIETWAALKRAASPITSFFLLKALDLKRAADGSIRAGSAEQGIFGAIYLRTFWISLVVTLACALLGYPVAYLLAGLPARTANLLLILVLLPFWTSVLVRTTAWVVLLQSNGVVNDLLRWTGLVTKPLELIFNRTGIYIAMIHVLLPLMILPLYSVMRNLGRTSMRAATSLGAHPFEAFLRVYLPQTVPGLAAGSLLVFISALGYYVTPALIGGADDQMISYFVAFYMNQSLNWGLASALGLVLLAATLAVYLVHAWLARGQTLRWT